MNFIKEFFLIVSEYFVSCLDLYLMVTTHVHIFQVAFQQADFAGWNLWAAINDRPLLPFRLEIQTLPSIVLY